MATPKKVAARAILNDLGDRENSIINDRCAQPPAGCGGLAVKFRNAESRREYQISGLCQKCQDHIFGAEAETTAI